MHTVQLSGMKDSTALTRLSNALRAARQVAGAAHLTVLVHPEDRADLMTESMRAVVQDAGASLIASERVPIGHLGIEARGEITA
jgi:hypothetical protein